MLQSTMRRITVTCIITILLTPLLAINGDWIWSQPKDGAIRLQAPPFFNTAQAEGATFFDEEAGIAAYFNAGRTLDLNNPNLQSLYRSSVTPTNGYLLGAAIVTETNPDLDYSGNDDVKLYISEEGWIMAYYHRSAPTSKVFDWLNWDGSGNLSTKLEHVLTDAASRVSAPQPSPSYYHFAFANANRMMLIADEYRAVNVVSDSFNFTPPNVTGFEYFEWSWSVGSLVKLSGIDFAYLLNTTPIDEVNNGAIKYDFFTSQRPIIGQTNTITIKTNTVCCSSRGVSGLAIIYKVP